MASEHSHRTQRLLPFDNQQVYQAFQQAELLAQWWGPEGFSNSFEQFEFREGGHWQFTMHGPDGSDYANHNQFVTLVPGQAVVIEHLSEPHFLLTITLSPADGGTLLHWEQRFDSVEAYQSLADMVTRANEENLDRMIRVLETAGDNP